MVERVGRFNGDKVPFYLEAYNAEMEAEVVDATLRMEFFCRVVAVWMHAEVKALREAHSSWEAFEEALRQAYGEPPKGWNRRDFDQWISATNTHRGAMKAFKEFERRFARFPEWEQSLVRADKFLLFVRSIYRAEWEAIGIEPENDDEVNGRKSNGYANDWMRNGMEGRKGKRATAHHHSKKRARTKENRRGSDSRPKPKKRTRL